jgi:hypothetical protein
MKTVQSSQAGKENLGIKYSSTSNINNKFLKTLLVISQLCAKIRILLQNGKRGICNPSGQSRVLFLLYFGQTFPNGLDISLALRPRTSTF